MERTMAKIYFRSFYNKVNIQFSPPFDNCVCIPLTHGYHTLIDSEDFEKISHQKWATHINASTNGKYVVSKGLFLHRVLMNVSKGFFIDHINHNGLDNRKSNLRICTKNQNGLLRS